MQVQIPFQNGYRASLPYLLALLASWVVATTIFGVIRNYSAVPFWDMWNGYLDFYLRSAEEGWSVWWSQHNEHRLVLAKGLFWVDLSIFRGSTVFLFLLNLVFPTLILFLFARYMQELAPGERTVLRQPLFYLLAVFSFSWIQEQNFTWAFQSQFFLAYLVPFLAFYLLARAWQGGHLSTYYWMAALCAGMLSSVTMANGLLVLPIFVVLSVVMRRGVREIALQAAAAVLVFFTYFHGYESVPWHVPWSVAIANNPWGVVEYFLSYLGAPVWVLSGEISSIPAMLAGIVLIGTSLWLALPLLRGHSVPPQEAALLGFILFFGGTALSTALGRADLGHGLFEFLPSRYQTPALMAWAALLLVLYGRHGFLRGSGWVAGAVAVPLALLFAVQQTHALRYPEHLVVRSAAMLTIPVGVVDHEYARRVFFDVERFQQLANAALEADVSVARLPEIQHARAWLGEAIQSSQNPCNGFVDEVVALPLASPADGHLDGQPVLQQDRGYRVSGWIYAPDAGRVPKRVVVLDGGNRVIGVGLSGIERPDVADVFGAGARRAGFIAYARSSVNLKDWSLAGMEPNCTHPGSFR